MVTNWEEMSEVEKEKKWAVVLQAMRLVVSEATFNAYLRPTRLSAIREREGRLICEIGCSSAFVKNTIEQRYWGQISEELERVVGKKCELEIKVEGGSSSRSSSKPEGGLPLFEGANSNFDEAWKKARLREDFTFDNYAVSGSNQLAFAAASAVAKKPGQAYNPLFIYGGVGVGKTHLMQAIGHEVLKKSGGAALFCSGEEFTNDLVEAIRFKTTDKVRAKYRKVRTLLIDDVQFIAGKPTVQEEFFHTFNTIQREGGQVVMTSDRPPGEIAKLEERLKSRFGAGLLVDIGPADFELRTAILLIKAKQKNVNLDMDIAQMIANHIEGVREIQGFLTKLITDNEFNQAQITKERVLKLLNVKETPSPGRIVTPMEVVNQVANFYGIGVQQLKGERRTKVLAWPRQITMYLLRIDLRLPLEEVGRLLGGRDHTTVMHGSEKVKVVLETNAGFAKEMEEIKKRLLIS